jgi:GNAT superfamily N-acetyltransferase
MTTCTITLAPVTRDTAEHVLRSVFAGMSGRSRLLRYFAPIAQLSPPMIQRLSAVDGITHLAVAAWADGEPVGVARLIADGPRCTSAELAVEVADAWHRRGLGRALVREVADAGCRRGWSTVVATALDSNHAVVRLMRAAFHDLERVESGDGESSYRASLGGCGEVRRAA